MAQKLMVYDGLSVKGISPWDLDSDKGWTPLNGPTKQVGIDLYFARVPWLYRGVMDRANNVASMPFAVMRGGTDFADNQVWDVQKTDLAFLSNPKRLFHQLEQSLAMTRRAYVFLETNASGYVKAIKYCNPYSITEKYNEDTGELMGYERTYGKRGLKMEVAPENILAIYGPDFLTETGPAQTSDAKAALTAAGVLFNADRFIANYFERGAIKATILTVDGGRDEAERLQSWWGDVIQGVKNAWSAVVLRMKEVKATVIGEGLESLQNNELTTERRQDIATALGVPESHLWSAAANYATKAEDEKQYIKGTITPECELIAEAFNAQLFTKAHRLDGYAIEFRPETLEIFQADAAEQAQAASTFAELFEKFPTFDLWEQSLIMHGYELPDKLTAAAKKYYADKESRAEEMAQAMAEPPETGQTGQDDDEPEQDEPPQPNEQEVRSVLAAWKRKAELFYKKTGSALCPFETTIIPADQQAAIRAALARVENKDDIKAAMDAQPDYLGELRRANDLLERMMAASG